jgi:hypothetical protein
MAGFRLRGEFQQFSQISDVHNNTMHDMEDLNTPDKYYLNTISPSVIRFDPISRICTQEERSAAIVVSMDSRIHRNTISRTEARAMSSGVSESVSRPRID